MPEHVGRKILLSTARLSELQAALTEVLGEDGGEDWKWSGCKSQATGVWEDS